ncbi:ceramidase domain-containing protein [Cognatishimia sp. WU-CL00825]|uniref:ceramidase domain-containing protein n=1 Tax=Cognatishimia sp. WU-CL00825 TaxID=3127658 RepID=UPI003109EE81
MDWAQQVDGYCERLDSAFWAEPVNAVTNLAFVIVALLMWRRSYGLPRARVLCIVLALIGLGSFLFHTFAQTWAGLADTLPILLFVLLYIFAATRDFWQSSTLVAFSAVLLFVPYAALTVPVFQKIAFLGSSAAYGPVPLLILIYALGLSRKVPQTAKRLAVGAGLIFLSIVIRATDLPLCPSFPLGTHFLWHLLNAVALGWMIETYRRHMLAPMQNQG